MCIDNCIDECILIIQSATLFTAFSTIINTHKKRWTKHKTIFYNEYVHQLLCQNEHGNNKINIFFN